MYEHLHQYILYQLILCVFSLHLSAYQPYVYALDETIFLNFIFSNDCQYIRDCQSEIYNKIE